MENAAVQTLDELQEKTGFSITTNLQESMSPSPTKQQCCRDIVP